MGIIAYNVGSLFLAGRQVGTLQNIELDVDFSLQKLKGETLFAKAAAFSEGKGTVKIGHAELDGTTIAAILGVTPVSGSKKLNVETTTIGTSPVTYAVTNGATATQDLGCKDANTNLMSVVASGPTVGQYSVALISGTSLTYTFATNQGKVYVSYESTQTSGWTSSLQNILAGSAPTFQLRGYNTFTQAGIVKQVGHVVYAVVLPKLSLSFKNGAFTEEKLDGEMIDDGTGHVIDIFTSP